MRRGYGTSLLLPWRIHWGFPIGSQHQQPSSCWQFKESHWIRICDQWFGERAQWLPRLTFPDEVAFEDWCEHQNGKWITFELNRNWFTSNYRLWTLAGPPVSQSDESCEVVRSADNFSWAFVGNALFLLILMNIIVLYGSIETNEYRAVPMKRHDAITRELHSFYEASCKYVYCTISDARLIALDP